MKTNCHFHFPQKLIEHSSLTPIMKNVLTNVFNIIDTTPFYKAPRYDEMLRDINHGFENLKTTLKVTLDWQKYYGDPGKKSAAVPATGYFKNPQAAPSASARSNKASPQTRISIGDAQQRPPSNQY